MDDDDDDDIDDDDGDTDGDGVDDGGGPTEGVCAEDFRLLNLRQHLANYIVVNNNNNMTDKNNRYEAKRLQGKKMRSRCVVATASSYYF